MSPKELHPELEKAALDQIEELHKVTTVETLHNDEAVKVLAKYEGDFTWTPEEEKKLRRKIDRRLLSILVVTYGLQYYDKAMLSQAVWCSLSRRVARVCPQTDLSSSHRHYLDYGQT